MTKEVIQNNFLLPWDISFEVGRALKRTPFQ